MTYRVSFKFTTDNVAQQGLFTDSGEVLSFVNELKKNPGIEWIGGILVEDGKTA